MKEIILIALLPVVAILTVLAFQQYMQGFGMPAEMDMDEQLFPERY